MNKIAIWILGGLLGAAVATGVLFAADVQAVQSTGYECAAVTVWATRGKDVWEEGINRIVRLPDGWEPVGGGGSTGPYVVVCRKASGAPVRVGVAREAVRQKELRQKEPGMSDRSILKNGVGGVLRICSRGIRMSLRVNIEVSGELGQVVIEGADKRAQACAREALRGMRFPEGAARHVDFDVGK